MTTAVDVQKKETDNKMDDDNDDSSDVCVHHGKTLQFICQLF